MFQAFSPFAQGNRLLGGAAICSKPTWRAFSNAAQPEGDSEVFLAHRDRIPRHDRGRPPLKPNIDRITQGGCLAFPIPLDKSSDNRQESIGEVLALASLGP